MGFWIALGLCYGTGILALALHLRTGLRSWLVTHRAFLLLGMLVHAGLILAIFRAQSSFIPSSSSQSQLVISWALALATLLLGTQRSTLYLAKILNFLALACLILAVILSTRSDVREIPDPWLWVHIVLMIVGEICFVVGAAISLVYLMTESELRARRLKRDWFERLPSLPDLDHMQGEVLMGGFFSLTLGMGMGFIFAQRYWHSTFWWDPKVILCALTWAVYAVLLGMRSRAWFRGRRSAWTALLGLVLVFLLSFGLDRWMTSRHSQPSSEPADREQMP